MKAYLQLTLGQLRLFARNRQVLFWSLFFPIIFMLMLGSFMGRGGGMELDVLVIDQDHTRTSQSFVAVLRSSLVVKLTEGTDLEKALRTLKQGNSQIVVVVPQGYDKGLADKTAKILMYYDDTNLQVMQTGSAVIGQFVDKVSKEMTHYSPAVTLQMEGVQALNLKYIDFLVPGIVAMMIMSNNLNGVAGQIASWRERGILRRMQSTPLKASSFIAAQITARLLFNGLQAVIVLLIGSLVFHTKVNGSWWLLLLFVVLGTLSFMSIGFIVASLAKTPESAGPIAGFISFPMLFLGGVFFSLKSAPAWLQTSVKLLPITHLTNALRQVMNVGADLSTLWPEASILLGWLVAAFAISSITFKWE